MSAPVRARPILWATLYFAISFVLCAGVILRGMFLSDWALYIIGGVALYYDIKSCRLLWPHRASLGVVIYSTLTALTAAFITIAMVAWFSWWALEKIARFTHHP
jgi:hypothetical protein